MKTAKPAKKQTNTTTQEKCLGEQNNANITRDE